MSKHGHMPPVPPANRSQKGPGDHSDEDPARYTNENSQKSMRVLTVGDLRRCACHLRHDPGCCHPGKHQDGANGEINSSGDNDKSLTDRQQQGFGGIPGNIGEIGSAKEIGTDQAE